MLLDTLYRWNRWGSNPLNSGIIREVTPEIYEIIDSSEIVPLIGSRRSGKSTILYQIIDLLEKEGTPRKAILHINFEEPNLAPYLNLKGLDAIYDEYREHIFPEGKAYLFLDEIQNIPEWERWVRARNKTEEIKIFITGSSAQLMSRELATLLTGRHRTFEIFPLSFKEFLHFESIEVPDPNLPVTPSPIIRKALNTYLTWGGFPAVVLTDNEKHKRDLLVEYFDDILYKDIVLRHEIRNPMLLRSMAIHLFTNTASLTSFDRIGNIFEVSSERATSYCNYIQEAFLVEFLSIFSLKSSVRKRNPYKTHVIDLGLRNAIGITMSKDEGHLIETTVYHTLRRKHGENIYYWKGKKEIDFVVLEGNTVTQIWQIAAQGLDHSATLNRECNALKEAQRAFPRAQCYLVSKDLPEKPIDKSIKIIPLWQLLLME